MHHHGLLHMLDDPFTKNRCRKRQEIWRLVKHCQRNANCSLCVTNVVKEFVTLWDIANEILHF